MIELFFGLTDPVDAGRTAFTVTCGNRIGVALFFLID